MRKRTVFRLAAGAAAIGAATLAYAVAGRTQHVHAAAVRRAGARARRRAAAHPAPLRPAHDAGPAAQAALGGVAGGARPGPGRGHRRQHGAPDRRTRCAACPAAACSTCPARSCSGPTTTAARCGRTRSPTSTSRAGVRPGRGAAGRGAAVGPRRRRLGRPQQRADDAEGRRPARGAGRRGRPARRTRRLRAGGRRGLGGGRPARRRSPTRRSRRSWTRWPRTASTCCWPGTPTAARSACRSSGALVTNCGLPRTMARGLHRWPGTDSWLHVSAGLGTHPTAPVRFACRAGGVAADAHPALTGWPGDTRFDPRRAWATIARHASGCGAAW